MHDLPTLKTIIDGDAFRGALLALSHLRRLVFCFAWTDEARMFVQDERIAEKLKGLVDAEKLWVEWKESPLDDEWNRLHYHDAVRFFATGDTPNPQS